MRIGVFGGGQLGMMLGQAGVRLGHSFTFLDPNPEACASTVGELVVGSFTDPEAIGKLVANSDVVTAEFENVPFQSAELAAKSVAFHPNPKAFLLSQERIAEKTFLRSLGIRTASFRPVSSLEDLALAIEEIGFPLVLKTTRLGYDGKGQSVVRSKEEAQSAFASLTQHPTTTDGPPVIAEQFLVFTRELSIIGARTERGEIGFYPLAENAHRDGILRRSVVPAPDSAHLQREAEGMLTSILKYFAYVGVLTLELFEVDGMLYANEMAPRVHNSGHWSIEGAYCSQFENHIRAISGDTLGETRLKAPSVMLNVLGTPPRPSEALTQRGVYLHMYGKAPAPLRKIGHITITEVDPEIRAQLIASVSNSLG